MNKIKTTDVHKEELDIDAEVRNLRIARYDRRAKQRARQRTLYFRIGHFLGLPGFEYKERNVPDIPIQLGDGYEYDGRYVYRK